MKIENRVGYRKKTSRKQDGTKGLRCFNGMLRCFGAVLQSALCSATGKQAGC